MIGGLFPGWNSSTAAHPFLFIWHGSTGPRSGTRSGATTESYSWSYFGSVQFSKSKIYFFFQFSTPFFRDLTVNLSRNMAFEFLIAVDNDDVKNVNKKPRRNKQTKQLYLTKLPVTAVVLLQQSKPLASFIRPVVPQEGWTQKQPDWSKQSEPPALSVKRERAIQTTTTTILQATAKQIMEPDLQPKYRAPAIAIKSSFAKSARGGSPVRSIRRLQMISRLKICVRHVWQVRFT